MTATPKITYRQYGGKASIAKWVVSHFPEHRVYMEPCCASAAVLLAKPRSFVEIINDLDDRIMGMWRAIKSQPEQLAALLWATPYTAANWRSLPPPGDIEEAVLLMAQGTQFYCGNLAPLLRVANHRARVKADYQQNLLDRVGRCWQAVTSGNVFPDLSPEENAGRREVLEEMAVSLGKTAGPYDDWFNEVSRPQFKR